LECIDFEKVIGRPRVTRWPHERDQEGRLMFKQLKNMRNQRITEIRVNDFLDDESDGKSIYHR